MSFQLTSDQAEAYLDWIGLTDAMLLAHSLPRACIEDSFLYRGADTSLTRTAWIDGLGILVKTANIMPQNPNLGLKRVEGAVSFFADQTGVLEAMIDFQMVTKWKTAADSLLGARLLARPDSHEILIVGAGVVAKNLRSAYGALFPRARFTVWARDHEKAVQFADLFENTEAKPDLELAVASADIVSSATLSREPFIKGAWLQPGQHIDLIGAFRSDMREVDDEALLRSRLFVDSRETVLEHIGEFLDPISRGVIQADDVVADLYDHASGAFSREDDHITLYKNGGGAHLDLMTCGYILDRWRAHNPAPA